MNKYLVAAIQMDSQEDKAENLRVAAQLIEEAVERGAKLVVLPECMEYAGNGGDGNAEAIPGPTFAFLAELAKKHGIWLHCGSVHEKVEGENRPCNTSYVIRPDGTMAGLYRKMHMSDLNFKGAVHESDFVKAGNELVTVDMEELGVMGMSICYDIRFPELYRALTLRGANVLVVPALFYMMTGKDHWETMLRTRAIENGCYVIAPDQVGQKNIGNGVQAYGKTMIIDPWGDVIARASDKTCVIMAEIDLDYVQAIRMRTGTLDNRREDIYQLITK